MSAMELAFEEELKKLPPGAQINIRDAMQRGESLSYTMFKAGWEAQSKLLESNKHTMLENGIVG